MSTHSKRKHSWSLFSIIKHTGIRGKQWPTNEPITRSSSSHITNNVIWCVGGLAQSINVCSSKDWLLRTMGEVWTFQCPIRALLRGFTRFPNNHLRIAWLSHIITIRCHMTTESRELKLPNFDSFVLLWRTKKRRNRYNYLAKRCSRASMNFRTTPSTSSRGRTLFGLNSLSEFRNDRPLCISVPSFG